MAWRQAFADNWTDPYSYDLRSIFPENIKKYRQICKNGVLSCKKMIVDTDKNIKILIGVALAKSKSMILLRKIQFNTD